MKTITSSIGMKIKRARICAGLTLQSLGDAIGSSRGYVWDLENRNIKDIGASKLLALSKKLCVSMEYLTDDSIPIDETLRDGM